MARGKYKRKRERAAMRTLPIEGLSFSMRVENLLKRNGLNTLDDIVHKSKEELSSIRGLGVGSLAEIESKLQKYKNGAE